jgi:hypothetical protein
MVEEQDKAEAEAREVLAQELNGVCDRLLAAPISAMSPRWVRAMMDDVALNFWARVQQGKRARCARVV